jgi:hypothetical protein
MLNLESKKESVPLTRDTKKSAIDVKMSLVVVTPISPTAAEKAQSIVLSPHIIENKKPTTVKT